VRWSGNLIVLKAGNGGMKLLFQVITALNRLALL
jgi:hypothetical protein